MHYDLHAGTQVHESALAAAPYGVFLCAADGTFRYVNAAFEQLTGYRADELIGRRTFYSLHDPAELARRRTELPAVGRWGLDTPGAAATASLMKPTRYESEWTYVRRNNTRIAVMLALSPLSPDRAGEVASSRA
jgi:PAS domain-containing protein